MANIYTYSVYTKSELSANAELTEFTVPTSGPALQLHIADAGTDPSMGESPTVLSRTQGTATGYIFDPSTGTYTESGFAILGSVSTFNVNGGTITLYTIDVDGVIYSIISESDQQAFAGNSADSPTVIENNSIDYDAVPSWGETLTGAEGGPALGGDDKIFGLDGDDSLRGLSGNDTITGGDGNDSIDGAVGDDSILGEAGDDVILGGENNDTVEGGDGDDIVYGDGSDVRDPGQDAATFTFNRANIESGQGTGAGNEGVGDSITYKSVATTADGVVVDARFTIVSITEADGVTPSSMPVDLNNSDLSDPNIVVLNAGNNLQGGAGTAFGGHKTQIIVEFFAASGPNTGQPITLNGTFVFRDLDETDATNGLETDIERVTVATSEFTSYELATNTSVEVVDNGNSFTFSGTRPNNQETLSAVDQEQNQVALDFVNRESFTVTLTSRRVNSGFTFDTRDFSTTTIVGDASNEGDDLVSGGAGNDTLYGSSGNDTLDGGIGNDLIDAGNDSDLILLNDGFGADTILGAEGGTDVDTLSAIGLTTNGVDVIISQYANGNYTGTAEESGTGDITQFSEIETLILSNNDDSFDSTAVGAVTVAGLGGDDTISTGTGDDSIDGGSGSDIISAGEGNDSVRGGSGNDSISSGAGNDTIFGGTANTSAFGSFGSGADTISSGGGDDFVYAGDGNDLIIVGSGNDSIRGQSGNDSFQLTDNFAQDTLQGDGGNDTIDASQLTAHGIDVVYSNNSSGTISDQTNGDGSFNSVEGIIFSNQADHVVADNITSDSLAHDLAGGDDTYDADGSSSNRSVSGNTGNDTIVTGSGDDSIDGGDGNDSLQGNAGSDTISGGDGDDTITLFENDTATGGDGDDLFNFAPGASTGAGGDTISITGGEDGDLADIDTLSLAGLLNGDGNQLTKNDITFLNAETGSFSMGDGTFVSFSEIERVICFDAEARITTPTGPRAAGKLKVGDLVVTRDHGLQPIRWIGRRSIAATGLLAPIEFDAGVFGNRNSLRVSPQHRMLVRDSALRLSHGVDEMLVAAKHMVNDTTIRQVSGGTIEYVHLMFDRHAIIFAEGIESESFHPGEMAYDALDPAGRSEMFSLFPELAVSGPHSYGPSSRETLKSWELPASFARSA